MQNVFDHFPTNVTPNRNRFLTNTYPSSQPPDSFLSPVPAAETTQRHRVLQQRHRHTGKRRRHTQPQTPTRRWLTDKHADMHTPRSTRRDKQTGHQLQTHKHTRTHTRGQTHTHTHTHAHKLTYRNPGPKPEVHSTAG